MVLILKKHTPKKKKEKKIFWSHGHMTSPWPILGFNPLTASFSGSIWHCRMAALFGATLIWTIPIQIPEHTNMSQLPTQSNYKETYRKTDNGQVHWQSTCGSSSGDLPDLHRSQTLGTRRLCDTPRLRRNKRSRNARSTWRAQIFAPTIIMGSPSQTLSHFLYYYSSFDGNLTIVNTHSWTLLFIVEMYSYIAAFFPLWRFYWTCLVPEGGWPEQAVPFCVNVFFCALMLSDI